MSTFESLPVELITEILCALDVMSLVACSQLSRRIRAITSDPILNPWRMAIIDFLRTRKELQEDPFSHLGRCSIFPEHNWQPILCTADLKYLLWHCSIPPLDDAAFEDCFRRRFLPSWAKPKPGFHWRQHFLRISYRLLHRIEYPCTAEENWTKYVVFYHNGKIEQLETASRSFNPVAMFEQLKQQDSLTNIPTRVHVVLQLRDMRVLAFGVLSRTKSTFRLNRNAEQFLRSGSDYTSSGYSGDKLFRIYPTPAECHSNYPLPSLEDWRWNDPIDRGHRWIGSFLITVQLMDSHKATNAAPEELSLQRRPGGAQFASFTCMDLEAIAPWMKSILNLRGVTH